MQWSTVFSRNFGNLVSRGFRKLNFYSGNDFSDFPLFRPIRHLRAFAWKTVFIGLLASVSFCQPRSGKMLFENLRIAETPPAAGVTAGYFTLKNDTKEDDSLIGVSSDLSEYTEIHLMYYENDLMKMERKETLPIASGESVVFEPGSFHLMFIDLKRNAVAGETAEIVFTFEKAGEMKIKAPVKLLE